MIKRYSNSQCTAVMLPDDYGEWVRYDDIRPTPPDEVREKLKAALRKIVELEPEYNELPSDFNFGCPGCERARQNNWPPSNLCDAHYREHAKCMDVNKRARNTLYVRMREIARLALEQCGQRSEPELVEEVEGLQAIPRPTPPDEVGDVVREIDDHMRSPVMNGPYRDQLARWRDRLSRYTPGETEEVRLLRAAVHEYRQLVDEMGEPGLRRPALDALEELEGRDEL